MEIVFFWVVMALVVAVVAAKRGRSAFGWFLYGMLIWPVALIHALVAAPTAQAEARRAATGGRVKCRHCAEFIKPEAKVCPFCRRDLPRATRRDPGAAFLSAGPSE